MPMFFSKKKGYRFLSFLLSFHILFSSIAPASAGFLSPPKPPSIPAPSQAVGEVEQRYNINTESVRDQGQNLNTSSTKKVTPEVSMFFSPSDPREGERISARAFPTYFSSDMSKLYFTWYLQRAECKAGGPPTAACDLDENGLLNHNDWKIAAHRILAGNDFEYALASYATDTDNDGYFARFGGDNRVNVPNHCYYHDNSGGENYEIVDNVGTTKWTECDAAKLQPVCMVSSTNIDAGSISGSGTGGSASGGASASGSAAGGSASGGTVGVSGSTFEWASGDDYVSGLPYCDASGTAACATGTPCCVSNPATARTCGVLLNTCSFSGVGDSNPTCKHLFPKAMGGFVAGDGTFGAGEEKEWQTDPNDPDTSDTGNKDEANIVGLGRDKFEWNYLPGDKVGVVVEGTSMVPTKHNDSSNMIMWAFSKNNCKISRGSTGTYAKQIEGYQVSIPTISIDLNDCLEDNLVDPTEGGQATNLELTVTSSPQDVINDISTRGDGDMLEVTATVNNGSQGIQGIFYEWRAELSSDGTANPPSWINITSELNSLPANRKLISQIRGNGVNTVNLNMNMQSTDTFGGRLFPTYLASSIGYLRFRVETIENFGSSGASRRGRSNTIVKFNASQDRILAHTVNVAGSPAKVSLNAANEICTGIVNAGDPPEYQVSQRLDGKLCRVIRNEIIGLQVPGGDLSNFSWSINGQPLVCNSRVSATNCFDDRQGNINFFPIIGSVGDVFNISVTANRLDPTVSTEKAVTITRSFKIVEPAVNIISNDQANSWAKTLGQYIDTKGVGYTEFSKNTLVTYETNSVALRALFTPDFLSTQLPPKVERAWTLDRVETGDGSTNIISFPASKLGVAVYNVGLSAVYRPSTEVRRAMTDIWGISALDTTEVYFNSNIQVEQPDTSGITQTGAKKYYALLANYLPASVLFSLKVLFSIFLILFSSGVVFAVIPNVPETSRRRL